MLIESRFSFVSESTTRGTTCPLCPISGSSIGQRWYKEVHWTGRGLNTLAGSSRLVPVMGVLSLKMNTTSVAFTCSGDYDPSRQPKPLLQPSEVSLLNDQMRSGTHWVQANWQVQSRGQIVCKQVGWSFFLHRSQQCKRVDLCHLQTWQTQLQTPQRSTRQRRSSCPLNRDSHCEQPNQINVY